MPYKGKLNADIGSSIEQLRSITKKFELKTKLYRILLRGKGLEFDSYRDYSPDDDSSLIDWKASKRSNKFLVKQYREERNLKIVFLIDVGDNMVFGSSPKLKCEYSAEVVSAFANLIMYYGDRAGYILFSEEVKKFVPPNRGSRHFGLMVEDLLNAENYGGSTNLNKATEFAAKFLDRNISSLIIVSDFLTYNEKIKGNFEILANKYELVAIMIKDPLDINLPKFNNEVVIEDPYSGEQLIVNPSIVSEEYKKYAIEQERTFIKLCENNKIDLLRLQTDKPFVAELAIFLKKRLGGL